MSDDFDPTALQVLLQRLPAVSGPPQPGPADDGCWRLRFTLDLAHPAAWQVVQELAAALNSELPDERLPVRFLPLSPPPGLHGGPAACLAWAIEGLDPAFGPEQVAEWLEARLPDPDDPGQWGDEEAADDADEASGDVDAVQPWSGPRWG